MSNQMLIFMGGMTNGGKTLVYNLIKDEGNFIYLELDSYHFHIYEEEMIQQIGSENVNRLKPLIKTKDILSIYEVFTKEMGHLMRQFPDYHFIIKPSGHIFPCAHYNKIEEWCVGIKKYMTIDIQDIYFFFVVRHPKISWFTINGIPFSVFINHLGHPELKSTLDYFEVIKIEELQNCKFLNKTITKTNLENVELYTNFDYINILGKNSNLGHRNYDNIEEEIKEIEKLHDAYELFGYDLNEEYVKSFCQDFIKYCQENGEEINEVFYRYS